MQIDRSNLLYLCIYIRYHIVMKKIKNNVKQSLIFEYINIKNITAFLTYLVSETVDDQNLHLLCDRYKNLCTIYEKLFFRFDMIDLSFSLLNREIKNNFSLNSLKSFDLDASIKIFSGLYSSFYAKVCDKIEHLTFNEFEKYYLLST